jgi:hypothetical protein
MTRSGLSDRRREQVRERAGQRCEYCRCPDSHSTASFVVDHIRPRSRGGRSDLDNLAFACTGCNQPKHDHITASDPETGESAPLYNPRRDRWAEHFAWWGDSSEVRGLTPTGRATVTLLELNRSGVVNLRRALVTFGLHPPTDD